MSQSVVHDGGTSLWQAICHANEFLLIFDERPDAPYVYTTRVSGNSYIDRFGEYEVCSENNGNFFISRVWRVLLSIFFIIMLVYMPLKYDKICSCIHCLLCLWQPLRLDVFLCARRFSFVKGLGRFRNFKKSIFLCLFNNTICLEYSLLHGAGIDNSM